jgi:putative transport protein
VGAADDVERAGQALGYLERPSHATGVVFVGLGIPVGGLAGLLSISLGGLPLSLTASGGALIMGLVFGWLRSVRPTFGRIPEAALWVFDTVGLAVFIGIVGLSAGPGFVSGLKQTGPSLLLVGFLVAVTPHLAALWFGHKVLKMNPVILFGACSGAGTVTAALRAIEVARALAPGAHTDEGSQDDPALFRRILRSGRDGRRGPGRAFRSCEDRLRACAQAVDVREQ